MQKTCSKYKSTHLSIYLFAFSELYSLSPSESRK